MPAAMIRRDNVYVLEDEAHRTTGGALGNYLVGALPSATYVGFTGTPIDRTAHGKGTFKVFGVNDPKGYLDKYSIKESIGDGTTVPLHYALAPNDLQVDRETLERELLDLAELEGVADVDVLNRVLDRAVTLAVKGKDPHTSPTAPQTLHLQQGWNNLLYTGPTRQIDTTLAPLKVPAAVRTIWLQTGGASGIPAAPELAALAVLQRKGRVLDAMSGGFAALRQRLLG